MTEARLEYRVHHGLSPKSEVAGSEEGDIKETDPVSAYAALYRRNAGILSIDACASHVPNN